MGQKKMEIRSLKDDRDGGHRVAERWGSGVREQATVEHLRSLKNPWNPVQNLPRRDFPQESEVLRWAARGFAQVSAY